VRCGHCVAACPTGSLSHREIPVEQCPHPYPERPSVDRRTVVSISCAVAAPSESTRTNRFPGDLARLIEVARYAPSGHNSQCAEWLVRYNRDELEKLAAIVAGLDALECWSQLCPELALSMHMDKDLAALGRRPGCSFFRDAR